MELRAEENHEALFARFNANHGLILSEVEEFGEFLEAKRLPVESRRFFTDPCSQFGGKGTFFHLDAVILQNIAEDRQRFFRTHVLLGRSGSLTRDHVAALAAGDLNQIALAELFDEVGKRIGTVGALAEAGIELQHSGFQQAQLRSDFAPLQNLQSALDQRHGLCQIQHRTPVSATAATLGLTTTLRRAALLPGTQGRATLTLFPALARATLVLLMMSTAGWLLPRAAVVIQ